MTPIERIKSRDRRVLLAAATSRMATGGLLLPVSRTGRRSRRRRNNTHFPAARTHASSLRQRRRPPRLRGGATFAARTMRSRLFAEAAPSTVVFCIVCVCVCARRVVAHTHTREKRCPYCAAGRPNELPAATGCPMCVCLRRFPLATSANLLLLFPSRATFTRVSSSSRRVMSNNIVDVGAANYRRSRSACDRFPTTATWRLQRRLAATGGRLTCFRVASHLAHGKSVHLIGKFCALAIGVLIGLT